MALAPIVAYLCTRVTSRCRLAFLDRGVLSFVKVALGPINTSSSIQCCPTIERRLNCDPVAYCYVILDEHMCANIAIATDLRLRENDAKLPDPGPDPMLAPSVCAEGWICFFRALFAAVALNLLRALNRAFFCSVECAAVFIRCHHVRNGCCLSRDVCQAQNMSIAGSLGFMNCPTSVGLSIGQPFRYHL